MINKSITRIGTSYHVCIGCRNLCDFSLFLISDKSAIYGSCTRLKSHSGPEKL